MKKFIFIRIILMSGMFFSCSNDDDQELRAYEQDICFLASGGGEGDTPPPIL